jgi:UDP-N-acetylmuramoyl-tripeptide--D-alanyl-D-alanine ligase
MSTPIPHNEASFSLGEILACTAGSLQGPLGDESLEVRGVCTDTRQLRHGEAFVALSGQHYDAHDHLDTAAARGAVLAIVQREVVAPPGLTLLVVTSTLAALGALAAAHLDRWRRGMSERRVIALTGSAGKTTTKETIAALLAAAQPHGVYATRGNLNNLVGVPLTLFGLGAGHRYAVVEMGTNAPGEIGRLTRMVRPDVGLLTLIAAAHTEGIGSLEDVAAEKSALFHHLVGAQATAVGNADDERVVSAMMRSDAGQLVGYGRKAETGYRVAGRKVLDFDLSEVAIVRPDGSELTAAIPLLGEVGALACAGAVAVVETLLERRLDGDLVTEALGAMPARMQPRRGPGDLRVIDDSYNANPASMRASVETAAELAASDRRPLVLVLGEMRELGERSQAEHEALADVAAKVAPALVIAVGGHARFIADRGRATGLDVTFCEDSKQAANLALRRCPRNALVLVKGSRSIGTERVVQALLDERPSETVPTETKGSAA